VACTIVVCIHVLTEIVAMIDHGNSGGETIEKRVIETCVKRERREVDGTKDDVMCGVGVVCV
jgi:hypothetical protein